MNTRVKRKISRFIGHHHLEHANNSRMESGEGRCHCCEFPKRKHHEKRKAGTIKANSEMDKAKWYHREGLGPGATHLKNIRLRKKTMQNSTPCVSTQVPTQLCLGQHINLFKTYTEKKILFFRLSKQKSFTLSSNPKKNKGICGLVSLTTLSSLQTPSPVSKQQGTFQNYWEVKPRAYPEFSRAKQIRTEQLVPSGQNPV